MKLKCFSCLFVIMTVFSQVSHAQTLSMMWQKNVQGTGDNSDRFNKIVSDGNGNFVGVGYTFRQGNYRDFLTVKFDANADTLWWATKNGKASGDDEATLVSMDPLGNIYVAGYTDGGITQDDIYLIKYDMNGLRQWDTTWNSPSSMDDVPTDMAIDGNGNIFITGNAEPDAVPGSMDYITLKFAPSGALIWKVQYSRVGVTSGKDEAAALALDSNGDCFVTGRSFNGGDDDMLTFKYDGTNGAVLFTQIYNGGSGDDRGVDIVLDNVEDVIVTGRSDNGNNQDFRTIKYTNTGNIIWSKFYNGPANQNDRPVKMVVDASNNIYIAGQVDVDNSALIDYDFVVIQYNSIGTPQWARIEGSNAENDEPYDLAWDPAGFVVVTGKADFNTNVLVTDNDFMTVKFTTGGVRQWTKFHSGTISGGSDVASSLVIDGTGNVYVAGGSENLITQKDATVIKYDPSGNVIWLQNYNGEGDFSESGRSIVIDANENAYIGGYSFRDGHNRDIFLVKLLSSGDTVCTFLYNGSQSDDDELVGVALDANANVYATGYTKSVGQKSDMFTMKWNPQTCDTAWTRIYNFSANQSDRAESLVVDAAGNVYITGRVDSDPNDTIDNYDIMTIKYDTNGNLIWQQQFNGTGNLKDEPARILLDNSGNVLVCGRTEKLNDDDFVILKYMASNGNPVWPSPALYNGPFANDDRSVDMTIDSNDNIFVCGYSQTGSGAATDDAAVVRFDSSGVPTAFFFYDGTGLGNDRAIALTHDNFNQIYVTFQTDIDPSILVANYDYLTIKFDNQLNQIWLNPPFYNGPINSDDIPVAITTNAAGNVFVTGYSKNDTLNGRTNIDWVTIRYDSLGVQSQISIFDGALGGDDEPNAMALRANSLWVTGFSIGNGKNQKDLSTLRYDLQVGIPLLAQNDEISIVYPNPFSDNSVLELKSKLTEPLTLNVLDVLGQLVLSLPMESNKLFLHRGALTGGMYFYRILNGERAISNGKFIIE